MTSSRVFVIVVSLSIVGLSNGLLQNINTITSFSGIESGNANDDIDYLLETFKSKLPSKVSLGTLHKHYARDCYLTGLANGVYRDGDAILDVTLSKVSFSFGLSTKKLTISCSWKKRIFWKKFKGTVKAFTEKISVGAKLSLELKSEASPVLNEFKVTEVQKIKTDVKGLWILNWIGERILNKRVNGAKDKFIEEMEVDVANKLREKLTDLKLAKF